MIAKVKEILKEKGLKMSDLADRLGVDQSNLQKSLSKNPTLSTLQDVANALNISPSELFSTRRTYQPIKKIAILEDGKTYGILTIPGIVQIPRYDNYALLRDFIGSFVTLCINQKKTESACGMMESIEFFCLIFDSRSEKFLLSICYDEKKMLTYEYDLLEFSDASGINIEQIKQEIINDVEGAAIMKMKEL